MSEIEIAIIVLKLHGYKIEPHSGLFDVVRAGSRLRLTKEDLIKYAHPLFSVRVELRDINSA